jgi:methyl-accepting chemotaxis protein
MHTSAGKTMKDITVTARLGLLVVLPLMALLLIVGLSIRGFGEINAGIGRIYDDRVVPLVQLKAIADDYAVLVIDAVNKADHSLITPAEALSQISKAKKHIDQNWQAYIATELTNKEQELANDAKQLFSNADQAIKQLEATLIAMGSQNNGELIKHNGPMYKTIDPISDKIAALIELQLEVAKQEYDAATRVYDESFFSFIALSLFALLGVAALGFWVSKSITHPLKTLRTIMERTQKESDLTLQVNVTSNDEIGKVAIAYNHLTGQFKKIIESIHESNKKLVHEATCLAEITEQTKAGASRQQQETESVATATTEMSQTVDEVAKNASQAANAAQSADEQAGEGNRLVTDMLGSTHQLVDQLSGAGAIINRVESDSNAIGAVLDVIRGIAEQTNLLALNAAIEAARAGDQGRGFAVVADEVRSLAQRTQESTAEIQSMILQLQGGSNEAVTAMKQGQEQVQSTVKMANLTSEALTSIGEAIIVIRDMNTQIATATEEQSSVAQEITTNVVNISEVSRASVDAMEKLSQSSQDLTKMAKDMNLQIAHFKIA